MTKVSGRKESGKTLRNPATSSFACVPLCLVEASGHVISIGRFEVVNNLITGTVAVVMICTDSVLTQGCCRSRVPRLRREETPCPTN